jgi:hypothetical protein
MMKNGVLVSTAVCCVVLLISLGGCPKPPQEPVAAIGVSATSHTFSLSEDTWTIDVWNAGDADSTLNFSVTPDQPWVTCTPTSGSSTGSSDRVSIAVTVSRDTLSPGTANAALTVSATGLAPVSVNLEVLVEDPGSGTGIPAIAVSAESHTFTISEETWDLEVWNSGDAGSALDFSVTLDQPWVTCIPTSGSSTGSSDRVNIAVTVSRDTLSPGSTNSTLTVTADELDPVTISIEVIVAAPGDDSDSDGLANETEAYLGTDPGNPDTDGDGLSDGDEFLVYRTLPLHFDTDGDGVSDGDEVSGGDDPRTAENAPSLYNETQHAIWDALDAMELQKSLDAGFLAAAEVLEQSSCVDWVSYSEETQESEAALCAGLKNGALFFVSQSFHAEDESTRSLPLPPAEPVTKGDSILNSGLPENPMVFVNLYEPGTNDSDAAVLADMARDRGCDAETGGWSTGGYGSVEWFKTLANYGVVYVDSHGDFVKDNDYVPGPTEPADYRPQWYGVLTADLRNTFQDDTYLNNGDFAERRIFLGAAVIDGPEDNDFKVRKSVYYVVSSLFFDTYCGQFEPHSIVWFNICKSGVQPPGGAANSMPPLWETFLTKNAGIIFGWNHYVSDLAARRASKYMFSMLLGDNRFEKKEPPLRPYGFTDAWVGLQENKYDYDEFYRMVRNDIDWDPQLGYVPRDYGTLDQEEPILAPTINGLFLDIEEEELTLTGNFGDRQGEVTIGDSSLGVVSWDVDDVVVSISPNDHGLVLAKVGNVKSNEVPLTQWSWEIEAEGQASETGPQVEATANFRGRADIHPWRPMPEDEADRNTQGSPAWAVLALEHDGTVTYSCSGTFEDDEYIYEHSGGGSIPVTTTKAATKLDESFQGAVMVDPDGGTFQVTVFAMGISHVKKTKKSDHSVTTDEVSVGIPFVIQQGTMDYYGKINGGTAQIAGFTLEWEDIEPASPPDENTPG